MLPSLSTTKSVINIIIIAIIFTITTKLQSEAGVRVFLEQNFKKYDRLDSCGTR
jgi:hypothetical protein